MPLNKKFLLFPLVAVLVGLTHKSSWASSENEEEFLSKILPHVEEDRVIEITDENSTREVRVVLGDAGKQGFYFEQAGTSINLNRIIDEEFEKASTWQKNAYLAYEKDPEVIHLAEEKEAIVEQYRMWLKKIMMKQL